MPATLSTKAVEQSTYIVTASFTDEDGGVVVPDSLQWSLVDEFGDAVNGRKDVSVTSPQSSEDIVLSGDDLVIDAGRDEQTRWLVIEGTYTSTAGSGLPIKDQVEFIVTNLRKVK
jgi:hypothetical protein